MTESNPRERPGLALLATSLGFAVVQLDVSVVNVAIRPIGDALGGGVSGLQWVVNGYTIAFAALILSAGALGDRVGAKRVFLAGFAVFTLASIGCGLAPTLPFLITSRVVQGIGAAALVPCSLSLLTHSFPDAAARARAIGLWAAGASTALSAGPLIGGLLTATLGWRWVFMINVPLGALAIVLTVRYSTETTRSSDRRLDLPGQLTAVLGLLLVAGSIVEGGRLGFGSALVLAGLGVGLLSLVGFVLVERRRADAAMLPLGLFGSREFSLTAAIGLVINIAFYGLIFVLSLYFQSVRHYSPLLTGLAFLPTTALVLATNVTASRIADRVGRRTVLVGSAVIIAASLAGLLFVGQRTPYPAMVLQLALVGAGLGLVVPVITSAMLGSVDASQSGIASGTLNTARQTGSVLGVALFGSFAARAILPGLRLSLLVSIGAAVVVGVLAVVLGSARTDEAGADEAGADETDADQAPAD